jgi:hypothetical protein
MDGFGQYNLAITENQFILQFVLQSQLFNEN